ncbi:MAG: UvrD-helicase domain-containing protein [Fimbriimonadaceae bacterium]
MRATFATLESFAVGTFNSPKIQVSRLSNETNTPTPEQVEAIYSDRQQFVVSASAGTGKTLVLVERYLRLVLEEPAIRPDQILAITFTKKAAAEMKRRIVDQLNLRGRPDLAQVAETGPIQTIHGFCQRLLVENCLDAGLDPDFGIASQAQTASWKIAAIRTAIAETFEDYPEVELVLKSGAGRYKRQSTGSPYHYVEDNIGSLLEQMRGSGLSPADIHANHSSVAELVKRYHAGISEDLGFEVGEGDFFEALATLSPRPSYLKGTEQSDRLGAELVVGLVQLALRAWALYERKLVSENMLDFTLLETRAIKLLQSPDTQSRIRDQYRVAMVDEAQDLNPLQYRLLDLMQIDQRMLIGDSKQSIYGFRQADVRLFREAEEADPLRLTLNKRTEAPILRYVDLVFKRVWKDNYIEMAPPMDAKEGDDPFETPEVTCEGVEVWGVDETDPHYAVANHIKNLVADGISLRDMTVLVRSRKYGSSLARALAQLKIPVRLVGISREYYTRLEVRDVANALQALVDPTDNFAMACLLRSPFVGLSFEAIHLLMREAPLFSNILSEPNVPPEDLAKLQEFLAWFPTMQRIAMRGTASEALAHLFQKTSYLARLASLPNGDQMIANVRKLQLLACESEEVSPAEFAEQIREIQMMRHDEENASLEDEMSDALRIMTIHQSKGLQFKVVIVPETTVPPQKKSYEVLFDPRIGLAATSADGHSRYLKWLTERKNRLEDDEGWRLMYVALTRPESRLCVVVDTKKPNAYAFHLAKAAGYPKSVLKGVIVR